MNIEHRTGDWPYHRVATDRDIEARDEHSDMGEPWPWFSTMLPRRWHKDR